MLAGGSQLKLSTAAKAKTSKQKILILGAGMSGLAAAHTLRAAGYQVQVVEGRSRLGGRIWTSNRWRDAPIDLGASWIHGVEGNPLTPLADKIKAERVLTSYDRYATYGPDGQRLTEQQEDHLEDLWERMQKALKAAGERDSDISVEAAVQRGLKWSTLSARDQQWVNFLLSGNIEQEVAGSSSQLSAWWYDQDKAYKGLDALFLKGYQVLIQYLAQGVPVNLGEKARSIEWAGPGVRLKTDKGSYSADRLIVTLPLGVLKTGEVRFLPELPAEKRTAIKSLGMGVLNKCYLRFARAFWPTDVDWIEKIPVVRNEWTEWLSYTHAEQLPILLGFNAGDQGREIESWSDARIVASAMKTLRQIYGPATPNPLDYQITRWGSDPFCRGSYSFNALGSKPSMREQLAQPLESRLHFAGEATERDHFSTVHGAYLSGLRAAQEVMG